MYTKYFEATYYIGKYIKSLLILKEKLYDHFFRWKSYYEIVNTFYILYYREMFGNKENKYVNLKIFPTLKLSTDLINSSIVLSDLLFAGFNNGRRVVYTHKTHTYYSMAETVEHRNIRLKTKFAKDKSDEEIAKVLAKLFLCHVQ